MGERSFYLVFALHEVVLDAATKELKKKQAPHICIHSCTSWPTQRVCASGSSYREARSGRVSITFSSAHLVVFTEMFGSPVVLIRGCQGQVHRMGQPSSMGIHCLVARGTASHCLWP